LFDHARRIAADKWFAGHTYFTDEAAARIVTRPPGVERQDGFSFCGRRPMPNALTVLIHLPNAVKGHAMAPALRIDKPERLRVVLRKTHCPKRDDDNPALHAVKVAQLEVPAAKVGVPADAVQDFVNGGHREGPVS
jgi:hypothetical protein